MKQHILPALRLTLLCLVLCSGLYPLIILGIAQAAPGQGQGETFRVNGRIVGYRNIGQAFSSDRYFQGRPSAVAYHAAGSGGSNKAASNPDYLQTVQQRIDTFLAHNPGLAQSEVPVELVTASGSGLDPDLSPRAARVQVKRIAVLRHLSEAQLNELVQQHTEHPFGGMAPACVNVLHLNAALDQLTTQQDHQ